MITIPVKNPIAIYNALMKPLWLMAAGESRPWYRVYLSGDRATYVIKSAISKFEAANRIPGIRGGVPNVLFSNITLHSFSVCNMTFVI